MHGALHVDLVQEALALSADYLAACLCLSLCMCFA